jgi:hypothetical protein
MHDYFFHRLLTTKTSRTVTGTPITVQIHIPPPAHPLIHPFAWFIIKFLSLRCDQARHWTIQSVSGGSSANRNAI